MIARVFHAWERRLHAVSKDRVVRPFDWGLDWIELNGHPPEATAEQILLDWASQAVADSQRFFATPDTTDYTFRPGASDATGELSFPSAIETPCPAMPRLAAVRPTEGACEDTGARSRSMPKSSRPPTSPGP